ncbi:MAG: phosphotransferase [bacterium]|nr:phosphotransferase [bacterium]
MSAADTIPTLEEVTAGWLSEVLRAAGHPDAEVAGFRHVPVGTGQFGNCVRFTLSYARPQPEYPATIVGKFPSTDEMTRTMAVAVRAYSREVGFYNRLRSEVQIATPHCYYAAVRDHGPEFVILMEDMHPAKQGDQIAGCDPSLARQITLALVGLHGPTWRDTSLAGAEWLSFDDPVELHNAIHAFFRSVLPEFLDRHRDELATEQKDLFQRLADSPEFPISPPVGEAFCAIHQDYRLDNLLLDTTRTPAAVTVVDWQSLTVGHPLSDVSYFLGGNLRVDQRRSVEERIVRDYHDALLDFGAAGLGWAECWEAYRRASIFGLATVVFASMGVERTERGDELIATMARRHTTHALDLGAEEFLD